MSERVTEAELRAGAAPAESRAIEAAVLANFSEPLAFGTSDNGPQHRCRRRFDRRLEFPLARRRGPFMHLPWALDYIGRTHRPTSAVETIGSFNLDPAPILFNNGEPGATPVKQLLAARRVKGRKREEHRPIRGVINHEVDHDGAGSQIAALRASGPGNLKVAGDFQSKLIVNAVEIGAHYS